MLEKRQVGHNKKAVPKNYEPAMTFDEIAAELRCNRQTVWVIYARAMEKIRQQLRVHPEIYREMLGLSRMRERPDFVFPDWRVVTSYNEAMGPNGTDEGQAV